MSEPSCSDGSREAGEPLAGTAPHAIAWVALEQNGPWGARAFTDSHLDPEVGRSIEEVAARHEVRPSLIRRPGRHADAQDSPEPRRTVLLAHTVPGATWLLEGHLDDPAHLLDLDWAALRAGDLEAVRRSLPSAQPTSSPHLLVCTNGRRDLCCAVQGRPVALGAAEAFPDQVWEVTHTSGHRFAPTAVLLPSGTLHGRLDVGGAVELVRAAGLGVTILAGSRGRSTWPAPAQAAELAVREEQDVTGLDDLHVVGHDQEDDTDWVTDLRHRDGRTWRVRVSAREEPTLRAESCGKALKPMVWFTHLTQPDRV